MVLLTLLDWIVVSTKWLNLWSIEWAGLCKWEKMLKDSDSFWHKGFSLCFFQSTHLRAPKPATQPQDPDHHGLHRGPRGLHGLLHPHGGVQQRRPPAPGRVEGQPEHGGHQPLREEVDIGQRSPWTRWTPASQRSGWPQVNEVWGQRERGDQVVNGFTDTIGGYSGVLTGFVWL